MSQFSGVVSRVIEKSFGNKTLYSFALSGQDGLFGTGAKRPPGEGTSISFKSSENARGYQEVDFKSITELADGTPSPAKVSTASRSTGGTGKSDYQLREDYWRAKELRDVTNDKLREVGASRNTAIAIIGLMVANEAVKLPAGPKREGFLWALLDKYTDKLMGTTKQEEAKKEAVEPEAAADEGEEEWS